MRRSMVSLVCAAACGVAFVGCGGSETPASSTATTTPTVTAPATNTATRPAINELTITVRGTQVSGGGRKTVAKGATVRLRVIADVPDEVHLHGYDLSVNVAPGKPGTLTFTADVPGIFDVELEGRGQKLLDLVVS